MIGGKDISIGTTAGTQALELALRAARLLWPQAIFEDADAGTRFERFGDLEPDKAHEWLIYKNLSAAKGWDEIGADPSLSGTLIHLLLRPGSLTIVIDDDATQQLVTYVDTVRVALNQSIFLVTATSRAAA